MIVSALLFMSNQFPHYQDGILYTILDAAHRTIQIGDGGNDNNAASGNIGPDVVFPESIKRNDGNYYIVTKISLNAFRLNKQIISVFIPATILHIDTRAFDQASNLEHIFFAPNSQLSILGSGSFWGLAIKVLVIPSTLTTCEGRCISRNSKLQKLYYCGDYVFTSQNLEGLNSNAKIYLHTSNKLNSLYSYSIIKSDPCRKPNFSIQCTLHCHHQKFSLKTVFFIVLFS